MYVYIDIHTRICIVLYIYICILCIFSKRHRVASRSGLCKHSVSAASAEKWPRPKGCINNQTKPKNKPETPTKEAKKQRKQQTNQTAKRKTTFIPWRGQVQWSDQNLDWPFADIDAEIVLRQKSVHQCRANAWLLLYIEPVPRRMQEGTPWAGWFWNGLPGSYRYSNYAAGLVWYASCKCLAWSTANSLQAIQ